MKVIPAEAQPLDREGPEILHKHIGALRHFLDEGEAALGFEVDGDRFLVGIVDHEVIAVGIGLGAGTERPAGLATPRVFDLYDLGAEPGERLGARRARLELREVENPNSFETVRHYAGFAHCFSLLAEPSEPSRQDGPDLG